MYMKFRCWPFVRRQDNGIGFRCYFKLLLSRSHISYGPLHKEECPFWVHLVHFMLCPNIQSHTCGLDVVSYYQLIELKDKVSLEGALRKTIKDRTNNAVVEEVTLSSNIMESFFLLTRFQTTLNDHNSGPNLQGCHPGKLAAQVYDETCRST